LIFLLILFTTYLILTDKDNTGLSITAGIAGFTGMGSYCQRQQNSDSNLTFSGTMGVCDRI